MTHRSASQCAVRRNRAFTLVEILVVIGVIVIIIGLLMPMVTRSFRQAGRVRAQADLQALKTALEAYRQDFGDIPRLPIDTTGYATAPGNPFPNVGAAILGKALLGPYGDGQLPGGGQDNTDPPTYQATTAYAPGDVFRAGAGSFTYVTLANADAGTPETDKSIFAAFSPWDGADGPGFRKRPGNAGPVSPPYVAEGKMGVRGTFLLDHYGNPILYFPASTRKRDLTKAASSPDSEPYVDDSPLVAGGALPLYNVSDNMEFFARREPSGPRIPAELGTTGDPIIVNRVRLMLGDFDGNGRIDSTTVQETAINEPYLLWSAGPDGIFGPVNVTVTNPIVITDIEKLKEAVNKCDDVVNFRQ